MYARSQVDMRKSRPSPKRPPVAFVAHRIRFRVTSGSPREQFERRRESSLSADAEIQGFSSAAVVVEMGAGVEDELGSADAGGDFRRAAKPSKSRHVDVGRTASAFCETATRTASSPSPAVPTTVGSGHVVEHDDEHLQVGGESSARRYASSLLVMTSRRLSGSDRACAR